MTSQRNFFEDSLVVLGRISFGHDIIIHTNITLLLHIRDEFCGYAPRIWLPPLPFVPLGLLFFLLLDIVFSQIAILTFSIGVVRLLGMLTIRRKLGLALAVVAFVAHVLRIVLFAQVPADKKLAGILNH